MRFVVKLFVLATGLIELSNYGTMEVLWSFEKTSFEKQVAEQLRNCIYLNYNN